jgi:UDPglucose 6-dehydrogenase/UDP-N-acetyl-D-galactosamine dehydrogenase
VILAGRAINDSMPAHVAGMMIRGLNEAGKVIKGSKVLIMGLAYKENVADIRESPARGIVEGDFFTKNRVKTALRAGLQFLSAKMDGVIVAVAHDEFRGMGLSGVSGFLGAGAVVVDVRGMLGAEGRHL